ncbi:MAG: hypothetical protein AB7P08_17155 [Burkholderiales bacterium]
MSRGRWVRMPPRVRRLNADFPLGVEAGMALPPENEARDQNAAPRLTGREWMAGFAAMGAFMALLAIVAVNEEFAALQEALERERQAATLWTHCRAPRLGERLMVALDESAVAGGPEYTCAYEPPRRGALPGRLEVRRVAAP